MNNNMLKARTYFMMVIVHLLLQSLSKPQLFGVEIHKTRQHYSGRSLTCSMSELPELGQSKEA